jgi:hypothetical protein
MSAPFPKGKRRPDQQHHRLFETTPDALCFFQGVNADNGCFLINPESRIPPCIVWGEVIDMSPCELTTAVSALANVISANLSDDELSLLGAILTQLGDTLETISVQREVCKNRSLPQSKQ